MSFIKNRRQRGSIGLFLLELNGSRFHEKVSDFSFGSFKDFEVKDVVINLVLEEVDVNGQVTTLGSGTYTVMSWERGIAHPVPTWIKIANSNNEDVANAQVYIVHKVGSCVCGVFHVN